MITFAATLLTLATCAPQESQESKDAPEDRAETVWEYLLIKYDKDADGKVTKKEYTRGDEHWKRLDKNGDGVLEATEFQSSRGRGDRRRPGGRDGEAEKPVAPKVGEKAPSFELLVLPKPVEPTDDKKTAKDGKPEFVKLSSFKGKKPVALIFGSYT